MKRSEPFDIARLIVVAAALGWTALIGFSQYLNWTQEDDSVMALAAAEARGSFEKDLLYRRWATMHGGVYVPVTQETPPNPYLSHVPDRDVVTTSGKRLTLMNPAYIMRQVSEVGARTAGIRMHITSLKPLRPENAADKWETRALKAFERGAKEFLSADTMDGHSFLRLMKPMITEEGCLKCHGVQGYKVGDVRGGIGVAIPLTAYFDVARTQKRSMAILHGIIWILGLVGIWFGGNAITRSTTKLRASEKRWQFALEGAGDGVWDWNCRTNSVFFSRQWKNMLGFEDPEVADTLAEWEKRVHPDDIEGYRRDRERHFKGETPNYTNEHRMLCKDGKYKWVLDRGKVVEWAGHNEPARVIGIQTDMSVQRDMERRLARAQKMEAVGQLTGGVAHDFNNLLQVMMINLEVAHDNLCADDPTRKYLDSAITAGQRGAKLTQQLLSFSRQQVLHPATIDANGLIEGMIDLLARTLGEDIEFEMRLEGKIPPVFVDPSGLENVLLNLALNSRAAMPKGGRLMVETDSRHLDRDLTVADETLAAGDYVQIIVVDTGHGMSPDVLARAFEPFYTTKEIGEGSGLGLSMIYGFIRQSGGQAILESAPGHGTKATLLLPVAKTAARTEEPSSTRSDVTFTSNRALVVEDDDDVRLATVLAFRESGWEVAEAKDGLTALAVLESGPDIDLLFTDVVMPKGMNGVELADKAVRLKTGLKVILTSGYPDTALTSPPIAEGRYPLLRKPFSRIELRQALETVLKPGPESRNERPAGSPSGTERG